MKYPKGGKTMERYHRRSFETTIIDLRPPSPSTHLGTYKLGKRLSLLQSGFETGGINMDYVAIFEDGGGGGEVKEAPTV